MTIKHKGGEGFDLWTGDTRRAAVTVPTQMEEWAREGTHIGHCYELRADLGWRAVVYLRGPKEELTELAMAWVDAGEVREEVEEDGDAGAATGAATPEAAGGDDISAGGAGGDGGAGEGPDGGAAPSGR